MAESSFWFAYAFVGVVIGWVGYYVYRHRDSLNEMGQMMAGMVFGTVPGFAVGVIYAASTGDYLVATIAGTVVGLALGVPFGKLGGDLGRMEGVMAGPMGGMMGAMLGFMARPFDLRILMAFTFFVVAVIMGEMGYLVYKSMGRHTPKGALYFAAFAIVTLFVFSVMQDYSIELGDVGSTFAASVQGYAGKPLSPSATPIVAQVLEKKQEINLLATFSGYQPEVIKVKAGVPVKINFAADNTAGCSRAIQFPDFGVRAIAQPGGAPQALEFTPQQAGEYAFYCSMRMFRGKLVVE